MKKNLKKLCILLSFVFIFTMVKVCASESKEINFADNATLYEAIKNGLQDENIPFQANDETQTISVEIEKVEKLNLTRKMLNNITQLSEFTNLKILYLGGNQIVDVTPISNLKNLTFLSISYNQVKDISSFSNLTKLTQLYIDGNQISDISVIANMTKLWDVYIYDNQIEDISALSNLTELTNLSAHINRIKDISPLMNLKKIEQLYLYQNYISDISALSKLTTLNKLSLQDNQIENLKPISNLTKLTNLNIRNNQVVDITPLAALKNLEVLDIDGNPIEDVSVIEKLPNLDRVYMGDINTVFMVKIITDSHGKVSPSNELKIVKGRGKTIQMLPDEGYEVETIIVDGVDNGPATQYTLSNVQHDSTIEVRFIKMDYWDVAKTDWFNEAVTFVSSQEIMNGVDATHFAPQNNTTRGMLVTVLYRLSKEDEKEFSSYKDVSKEAYYSHAVAWANKKEIVNGVGEGLFAPDSELTREQLVTILYRYAKLSGKSTGTYTKDNLRAYKDKSKVSSYAIEGFRWAVSEGIITGRNNNELAPQGTATRAEVATILQRFINK